MSNTKIHFANAQQEQDTLARKVVDLLRRELSQDELAQAVTTEVLWLAMQMLCGPSQAASLTCSTSANVKLGM